MKIRGWMEEAFQTRATGTLILWALQTKRGSKAQCCSQITLPKNLCTATHHLQTILGHVLEGVGKESVCCTLCFFT